MDARRALVALSLTAFFFIGCFLFVLCSGCATSASQSFEAATEASVVLTGSDGVFLAATVRTGDAVDVERTIETGLRRLKVAKPDNTIIKVWRSSSLMEEPIHRFGDGPPHLAVAAVSLRWRRISIEDFMRAKSFLEAFAPLTILPLGH